MTPPTFTTNPIIQAAADRIRLWLVQNHRIPYAGSTIELDEVLVREIDHALRESQEDRKEDTRMDTTGIAADSRTAPTVAPIADECPACGANGIVRMAPSYADEARAAARQLVVVIADDLRAAVDTIPCAAGAQLIGRFARISDRLDVALTVDKPDAESK